MGFSESVRAFSTLKIIEKISLSTKKYGIGKAKIV